MQNLPVFPECAAHVWSWFCDIARCRTSNGYSLNPVTWGELESWKAARKIQPKAWEVEAIFTIDAVYLETMRPKETDAS